MTTPAKEAVRAGKALVAALKRRDAQAAIDLMHPDIVLEMAYPFVEGENIAGARSSSGAAVHKYLRDAEANTTAMRFANETWRATSDGLAIYQADGHHSLRDGRQYRNHFLFIIALRDGRIVLWREYLNPVCAMRALGGLLEDIPAA